MEHYIRRKPDYDCSHLPQLVLLASIAGYEDDLHPLHTPDSRHRGSAILGTVLADAITNA